MDQAARRNLLFNNPTMDIVAYTLISQWNQLKIDIPGIRLTRGMQLLGCSKNEILRAEFNNNLTLVTKEVMKYSKPLSCHVEPSNQYR